MGSQASFAEEQPFPAEGMGFAFDNAEVSSVEMSELSGSEMDETEGAKYAPGPIVSGLIYEGATTAASYAWDYWQNTVAPAWAGASYTYPTSASF